jgi:hypothetical protein
MKNILKTYPVLGLSFDVALTFLLAILVLLFSLDADFEVDLFIFKKNIYFVIK